MPNSLRYWFTHSPLLYSVVLDWQLSSLGKSLQARAHQLGCKVSFKSDKAILHFAEGRELWLPFEMARELWWAMERIVKLEPRLIFTQFGSRLVCDARGTQKYIIPGSKDCLRMTALPESADLPAGYFAKGGAQPGSVAFDCGAFCGEIAVNLARQIGPEGRVVCFEPDAANRACLSQNISDLRLLNVDVIAKGLWKESTTLSFVSGGNEGSHLAGDGAGSTTTIAVVSFEEACRIAGAVPSFVKMDIEGAEVEAIEGSLDFIARHSIRFAIASYHIRDGQPTSVLLEALFRKAGYHVATGYPEHQTTWAWKE